MSDAERIRELERRLRIVEHQALVSASCPKLHGQGQNPPHLWMSHTNQVDRWCYWCGLRETP